MHATEGYDEVRVSARYSSAHEHEAAQHTSQGASWCWLMRTRPELIAAALTG